MKKLLFVFFLAITMLFTNSFQGYAAKTTGIANARYRSGNGHERGYPGRGRHHDGGSSFYWRGTFVLGPWYPYPYYYAPPPVIIQQQPPVYVQPQQPEDTYWYYCPDPQGYYPYIRECPGGWMKVVPDETPPNP